jgi:hypothetical protein
MLNPINLPLHSAVVAYVLVAIAIHLRNGYYTPWALALLLTGFVVLALGARGALATRGESLPRPTRRFLAGALVLLAIAGLTRNPLLYSRALWFTEATHVLSVATIAWALWRPGRSARAERSRQAVWLMLLAAALVLHALVVVASPNPRIDVWTMSQQSAGHLWTGKNPYLTAVDNPYRGESFGYEVFGYMYLPGVLYLQLIGYAMGDVRLASVLAEAVLAFTLWRLLRADTGGAREIVPLLLFANPRGAFVIEQAWTEPLILLVLCLVVLSLRSGRRIRAAGLYGFFLSLKHSLFFFPVHWLLLERRWRHLALGLFVGLATIVPFVVWDLESFWRYGVMFHLQTGFRSEALTVFGALWPAFGIAPGRAWTVVVGVAATMVSFPLARRLPPVFGHLWAVTLTTFAAFLFGSKAFCNYYYFVGGLLLLQIAEGHGHPPTQGSVTPEVPVPSPLPPANCPT